MRYLNGEESFLVVCKSTLYVHMNCLYTTFPLPLSNILSATKVLAVQVKAKAALAAAVHQSYEVEEEQDEERVQKQQLPFKSAM